MTETEKCRSEKKQGCGVMEIYNGVFRHRCFWRRTSSSRSMPATNIPDNDPNGNDRCNLKRMRGGVGEAALAEKTKPVESLRQVTEKFVVTRSPINCGMSQTTQRQNNNAKESMAVVTSCPVPVSGSSRKKELISSSKRLQNGATISGELESFMADYHGQGNLVRASSSNMMVFGNLGNIRQSGAAGNCKDSVNTESVLDYTPLIAKEMASIRNEKLSMANTSCRVSPNATMVNTDNNHVGKERVMEPQEGLCKALSRRLEPEELKILGNEEFKNGKYAEALAYYDLAITIDPDKASYRSNKSAALTGLGHLLEAVEECKVAIRIEPSYLRAHHRLATLYLRLGEADKALYQYKQAAYEADPREIAQGRTLQTHITRCNEARKLKDWNTMLKEAGCGISSGADSSPQLFASQAEALLKLHRHQEADVAFSSRHIFDPDALIKFFGASTSSYYYSVHALVDMAAGRFEEAVEAAQRGAMVDGGNKEAVMVARRARAVAAARLKGNELFRASQFREACAAYEEGLQHDQLNAVLLCNRAACRSKLQQWEKAIDDCNSALNVRPSYSKALLRRADCNAKLERWEASIQDYEALIRETPTNEEVSRALLQAQIQLTKRRGDDNGGIKFGSDHVVITDDDGFI